MSVICHSGNADQAPSWQEGFDIKTWSGLRIDKLKQHDVRELLLFSKKEASMRGWEHTIGHYWDIKSNLFHPYFLYGAPYHIWNIFYILGIYRFSIDPIVKSKFLGWRDIIPLITTTKFNIRDTSVEKFIEELIKESIDTANDALNRISKIYDLPEYTGGNLSTTLPELLRPSEY